MDQQQLESTVNFIEQIRTKEGVLQSTKEKVIEVLLDSFKSKYHNPWWNVIGVTPGALERLAKNNWVIDGSGLKRCHIIDRKDTRRGIANGTIKINSAEDLKAVIMERGRCVLGTSIDNASKIDLDSVRFTEEGSELFSSGGFKAKFKAPEAEWCKKMYANISS